MTQSTESTAAATVPQVHTYTTGTLVYEVNLSVPREKAEDYIDWLRGFTKVRGNTRVKWKDARTESESRSQWTFVSYSVNNGRGAQERRV